MVRNRSWLILAVSGLWLLSGIGISWAQKASDDKERAQAIESVKKNLAKDPKNEGLQHAAQCLENPGQCNDQRRLDQAIGSVKDNLKHHPEDRGMHHALDDLEHHHQDLTHHSVDHDQQMSHDRPMPHESMPHSDAPHSSDMPGSPHR